MEIHKKFFDEVLKPAMIELAVNDEFPLDLNELDFDTLVTKERQRQNREMAVIAKLSYYIDAIDLWESYERLVRATNAGYGDTKPEDYVNLYAKYREKYTVDELLTEAEYFAYLDEYSG